MALPEALAHRVGDRLRLVAVADVDLDLAAAQAGGDLDRPDVDPVPLDLAQALGDLRLRHAEHPQRVAAQWRRPRQHRPHRLGFQRHRPHRPQLARRAGQDDHDPLAGRDHQPRRGADGIERDRPLRHHRLLAVGLHHRLLVEVEAAAAGEAAQDLGDLRLHSLVEHQLAAGEAGDHLAREVVGGRAEAAGGDDQVHPLGGHEAQRRLEVVGAVGDDEDVGDLHPALGQLFGDPGAVGVGDAPGQNLGSRDDDAGANHAREATGPAPTQTDRELGVDGERSRAAAAQPARPAPAPG